MTLNHQYVTVEQDAQHYNHQDSDTTTPQHLRQHDDPEEITNASNHVIRTQDGERVYVRVNSDSSGNEQNITAHVRSRIPLSTFMTQFSAIDSINSTGRVTITYKPMTTASGCSVHSVSEYSRSVVQTALDSVDFDSVYTAEIESDSVDAVWIAGNGDVDTITFTIPSSFTDGAIADVISSAFVVSDTHMFLRELNEAVTEVL